MEPSTTHNQPRNYPPPLDTPHRGTPRGTPPYRPRQSGGTHCRNQIRRVSPTRSTRSAPTKADASTTFFHGSRTSSTPPGTTYSTGDRYRAQRIGIRLVLTCYGICPTCLREGRGHHVSASSLESRLLRLRDVCRRLTEHCRWTLHHWFHVKPTHEHGVGVMAERRRHPRGLHSQDR